MCVPHGMVEALKDGIRNVDEVGSEDVLYVEVVNWE